jgi:hypothetical protein
MLARKFALCLNDIKIYKKDTFFAGTLEMVAGGNNEMHILDS